MVQKMAIVSRVARLAFFYANFLKFGIFELVGNKNLLLAL